MAEERRSGSLSGLTAAEAKEFHKAFMSSTLGFVAVTAVAHLLIWSWRPWF
jgi:light-harvesting complex 1 beta chain